MNLLQNIKDRLKSLIMGRAQAAPNNSNFTPVVQPIPPGQSYNLFDPMSAIGQEISGKAKYYGITPRLLAAVLQKESSGNPYATREVSPADTSYGLSQVSVPTLRTQGFAGDPKAMYNPHLAIDEGITALKNSIGKADVFSTPEDYAASIYSKYNLGLNSPYNPVAEDPRVKIFRQIFSKMKDIYK